MEFCQLLGLITSLIVLTYLSLVTAEKTCRSFMYDLARRRHDGIEFCSKLLKIKSEKEQTDKMNCVLKCAMIREKFLSPEGRLTDEVFEEFLANEIPQSLVPKVRPLLTNCKETHSARLNPKEKIYCKSYAGLIECLQSAVYSMCS